MVNDTTGGVASLKRLSSPGHRQHADVTSHLDLFQFVYRSHNQSHDFTPFRNSYTGD